jgi:multidrug efflux pump subunit AcrB
MFANADRPILGLAAKNAILIVEFARHHQDRDGYRADEAAVLSARERLRPILMTSLAFIAGVAPLAVAYGAGSEMRQSLGTTVFFGMLGVTIFGLAFTPAFYTAVRKVRGKASVEKAAPTAPPESLNTSGDRGPA